jgi:hypothetical protein
MLTGAIRGYEVRRLRLYTELVIGTETSNSSKLALLSRTFMIRDAIVFDPDIRTLQALKSTNMCFQLPMKSNHEISACVGVDRLAETCEFGNPKSA